MAYLFLLHHHGLLKEIHNITESRPGVAADTKKAAAASIHVSVTDFDAIAEIYSQIEPLMEAIDNDANAYRHSILSGALPLDIERLRQFDARKTQLKATIKKRLQAKLSPAGWTTLNAYIEGTFRQSVHIFRRQP